MDIKREIESEAKPRSILCKPVLRELAHWILVLAKLANFKSPANLKGDKII